MKYFITAFSNYFKVTVVWTSGQSASKNNYNYSCNTWRMSYRGLMFIMKNNFFLLASISIIKGFSFSVIIREKPLNSHLEACVKGNKKHLGNTFNYLTGLVEDLQQKRCLKGCLNFMLIFMQFPFPAPSEHELIHPHHSLLNKFLSDTNFSYSLNMYK